MMICAGKINSIKRGTLISPRKLFLMIKISRMLKIAACASLHAKLPWTTVGGRETLQMERQM